MESIGDLLASRHGEFFVGEQKKAVIAGVCNDVFGNFFRPESIDIDRHGDLRITTTSSELVMLGHLKLKTLENKLKEAGVDGIRKIIFV